MASVDKRAGSWRAQVRRAGKVLTKTFRMKADAEAWARDVERAIDNDIENRCVGPRTTSYVGSSLNSAASKSPV